MKPLSEVVPGLLVIQIQIQAVLINSYCPIYILCIVALGFLLATLAVVFVQYIVLLIFFGLLLKLVSGVLVISYKYRVSFDKMMKFSEIYTYLHGLKGPL